MLRIAYHTLGCKVNQYETEKVREALEGAGFSSVGFGSAADAYVINTCSVTSVADGKSRTAIRRALRANPDAYVIVCGCYAELEPAQIAEIEGVDLIVPNSDKDAIPERIRAHFAALGLIQHSALSTQHSLPRPRVRTRAVVKVQDGCDQFCAYCVIPYARRGKTSRPLGSVLDELRALAEFGYKEIVLTGIRLGSYCDGDFRLPELVLAAAGIDGIERVRLSSVEPWEVDDALLDAMDHPKVCRHLHIPLQSGDDAVLGRMNRPYTCADYRGIMSRVRERIPDIGVTTDVIVGFPGETEAEFENAYSFIREMAFSRLHVFRYSPRKLTAAADMMDQVSAEAKKVRAERLIELGQDGMREFAGSFVGRTLDVLVEREVSGSGQEYPEPSRPSSVWEGKHLAGFADNYVEVCLPGDPALRGGIVTVRIASVDQSGRAHGIVD